MDPLDVAADTDIDAIAYKFIFHEPDQSISAPLERIDPFGHEIGKHDAVADRGVFERAAVGVGDRLHQEANHILAARKESVEQFASREMLVVLKVHLAGRVEKSMYRLRGNLELLDQELGKILAIERSGEREHRVIEPNVVELHDAVGDLFSPVPSATLHHAVGEPVERDIERYAPRAV